MTQLLADASQAENEAQETEELEEEGGREVESPSPGALRNSWNSYNSGSTIR